LLFGRLPPTQPQVEQFYSERVPLLSSKTGVLLFVYSIILTRGVGVIKNDMDDSSQALVARFGHCSQELVNLVVTGAAVTNVFDGRKVLDGAVDDPNAYALRGIPTQQDIGFLTLLEALRLSKVCDALRCVLWGCGVCSRLFVRLFFGCVLCVWLCLCRQQKVGNHYKTPRFPIWVVGSSSHYTFCFALNKAVGQVCALRLATALHPTL
jgi:hypothetical protein